ncbi:MAG: FecR family protein [Sphingobacterium sp.]
MNETLSRLIRLFWQGKLSKKARRDLLSELNANRSKLREEMQQGFGEIQNDEELHRDEDYERYWRSILEQTGQTEVVVRHITPWWQKCAVAVCLVFVAGLTYLLMPEKAGEKRVVSSTPDPGVLYDTLYLRNEGQEKKEFKLMDGSVVTLRAGSYIAYDERYGKQGRHLALSGEAAFSVAHDSLQPFVVKAHGYTTTALGTSFIVNARGAEKITVRLLTGKVVVKSTPQARYAIADQNLFPGDELAIQLHQSELKKSTFENKTSKVKGSVAKATASEEEGSLHFEEASLDEVLRRISAKRGTKFDVAGVKVGDLYFTGEFSAQDDLKTILDIISVTNGVQYEIRSDDSVKIRRAPGQ